MTGAVRRGPALLLTVLVLTIAFGAALRFAHLDTKVFWTDESYTALRVSGATEREMVLTLADGKPHAMAELRAFQRVRPGTRVTDTIDSLAREEPQHPPLFFVAERLWSERFGASASTLRMLPALASVLAIVAMFWLCRELMPVHTAPWIGAALVAVSPFQLAFAHEAREYSLWAALTLLANAALLRAVRTRRWSDAALYGLFACMGLYTDVLFAGVMLAHGLFVMLCERRATRDYAVATAAAVAGYVPWLVAYAQHRGVVASDIDWASHPMPLAMYAAKLAFNASAVFFDLEFEHRAYTIVAALVLALVALSLGVVVLRAPARLRTFILALLCVTTIGFIAKDGISHTYYATASRYLVPAWLALDLAVTYALAAGLASHRSRMRRTTTIALSGLLACGIAAVAVGTSKPVWWDNHTDAATPAIAGAVTRGVRPLVIVPYEHYPSLLVAQRYLDADDQFAIVPPGGRAPLPKPAQAAFVLSPTRAWRGEFLRENASLRLEPIDLGAIASDSSLADAFHRRLLQAQRREDEASQSLWRVLPLS